ncbi:protein javelin-like [Atheta coriaria]|uniref:protein javelin-like n=1 Tax=Dalotia coriaria TaxID=877792 RepID=UPI0031F471E7
MIKGNTPYYNPEPETYVKPRSLPNFAGASNGYESDSTLSDYDPKYYEPVERTSSDSNNEARPNHQQREQPQHIEEEPIIQELRPEKEESVYYSGEPQVYSHYQQQQQQQQQQQNHYQERTTYEESESKSEFSNIEANPIYDEIPALAADKDLIKTSIQVPPQEEAEEEYRPDDYKTVVSVPEQQKPSSDEDDVKEAKKHSHNYLKEFLETQKGSKKPLQNFLSKRISRAFNSTQDTTVGDVIKSGKKNTNLIENQYFSLPDITVSKNLQKCEKIDRKLRKCEKLQKSPSDVSTNRFIVNIGNHFDVTARSSIPVDFELKISKIPKAKKNKSDKNFIEAVKTLNQTLNGVKGEVQKNPKVIVNGEEINTNELFQRDKEVEVLIEDTKMSNINNGTLNKEFQSKINTMRNYWGSMVGKDPKEKESMIQAAQKEEKQDPIKDVTKERGKCKIVGMQTKIEEVKKKFEADPNEKKESDAEAKAPSRVQMTKQFFENNDAQLQKATNKQGLLENPYFDNQFESLNPNTLELIEQDDKYEEIIVRNDDPLPIPTAAKVEKDIKTVKETNDANQCKEKEKSAVKKSKSIEPEFDHIRYRVVKSDLFQKKIFAKCDKESQFDGLMQYLQDYSFQELLIDNNIVIIEPIRTNIQYVGSNNAHHTNKVTKFIRTPGKPPSNIESVGLRKHFFYHPIRVNREVNDDELPNPDTVKQVRQMFEGQMPRSQSSKHLDALTKQTVQYIRPVDPDKDRCSASDGSSNMSECDENDEYDEEADVCCEYVSEDILEKIRECGTSVTYYGGRVTAKRKPQAMTKAIMDEIQNQKNQKPKCNCACKYKTRDVSTVNQETPPNQNQEPNSYQGVKFKLLKSNSCSSRLELVGTKNLSEYRKKFIMKQKQILDEHNLKKQNALTKSINEKNHINESIKEVNVQSNVQMINELNAHTHPVANGNKLNHPKENGHKPLMATMNVNIMNGANNVNHVTHVTSVNQSPKIIGEEMKAKKLIQWGEMREDNKTYSGITYTHNNHKAKTYDFYEKVKIKPKKTEEMEFEPYEVAN